MKPYLFVALGSAIGGMLRYGMSQAIHARWLYGFPIGILTVNVVGCLALGLIMGISARVSPNPAWQWFLVAGLCGGFTTFSTFSYESLLLFRTGVPGQAALYIGVSVVGCIAATALGLALARL
jgi:CrcB protein